MPTPLSLPKSTYGAGGHPLGTLEDLMNDAIDQNHPHHEEKGRRWADSGASKREELHGQRPATSALTQRLQNYLQSVHYSELLKIYTARNKLRDQEGYQGVGMPSRGVTRTESIEHMAQWP